MKAGEAQAVSVSNDGYTGASPITTDARLARARSVIGGTSLGCDAWRSERIRSGRTSWNIRTECVAARAAADVWWQIVLRQFRSPLIYILGVAAVVSVAIGEPTDAGFIAAVLGLKCSDRRGYQEWRAEKSTQASQQLLQIRAAVVRDGEVCEIDAENVVPGDTVWLESGNRVPADLRLV